MARPPAGAVVAVRPAVTADHERILAIDNAIFTDYQESMDEFRDMRARLRAGGYVDVFVVAETREGEIGGYAHYQHLPWHFAPDRYRVVVAVEPRLWARGIGGALFAHAEEALRTRGAAALESFARETDARVISFLERRGFREVLRAWENRLDVSAFDGAPFAHYEERVRAEGVTVTTLAEERQRDPDALRKAHALHVEIGTDIPSASPPTPVPYEEFLAHYVTGPGALPEAYFIAKIGDEYVGEANLRKPAVGTHVYHNTTGVRRPHRGRGISMALKLATIDYARAHGYREVRTWNEIHNAGILAINERLGFARQPAWITFERRAHADG